MRTGLQISSLKKYIQTSEGLEQTLRRVGAMGCRDIQLQWMGGDIPAQFIAGCMRAEGMTCWGTQDYYDVVMARLDKEIADAHIYGSRYICVSGIPERFMSAQGVQAMAAEMRQTAARLADEGIILTFHPRAQEYVRFDGSADTATEMLLDAAPEVQFTLDAYHSIVSGMDTPALMRRYAGRLDMIHLKDTSECRRGAPLVPVGQGALDFAPVLAACAQAGVKVAFAEQESWQKDAFECMAESLEYVREHVKN